MGRRSIKMQGKKKTARPAARDYSGLGWKALVSAASKAGVLRRGMDRAEILSALEGV